MDITNLFQNYLSALISLKPHLESVDVGIKDDETGEGIISSIFWALISTPVFDRIGKYPYVLELCDYPELENSISIGFKIPSGVKYLYGKAIDNQELHGFSYEFAISDEDVFVPRLIDLDSVEDINEFDRIKSLSGLSENGVYSFIAPLEKCKIYIGNSRSDA